MESLACKVGNVIKTFSISLFIDCGSPAPTNGTADFPKGSTYGEVAIVSCNEGYTRTGSAFITCLANGTWSEEPTCNIVGKTCQVIFVGCLEGYNYMLCRDCFH
jgi:Sushi repeat (SCR repeat)